MPREPRHGPAREAHCQNERNVRAHAFFWAQQLQLDSSEEAKEAVDIRVASLAKDKRVSCLFSSEEAKEAVDIRFCLFSYRVCCLFR